MAIYQVIRTMDDGQVLIDSYKEDEFNQAETDYLYMEGEIGECNMDGKSIYLVKVFDSGSLYGRNHILRTRIF